jgi:hypothetical protein
MRRVNRFGILNDEAVGYIVFWPPWGLWVSSPLAAVNGGELFVVEKDVLHDRLLFHSEGEDSTLFYSHEATTRTVLA